MRVEMKTKKVRLAGIILFAVTLITVGVLVWPTPKEAKAEMAFMIHCVDEDDDPQSGVFVRIQFTDTEYHYCPIDNYSNDNWLMSSSFVRL